MKVRRITCEEFRSDYERYLTLAKDEALIIGEDDRDSVVLLNAEDYARLTADEPIARPVESLSRTELDRLTDAQAPEEAKQLDSLLPKDW
jgi:hypothetical protein